MKFSIVTPVYNGEKYLRQAIESVLSQKGDFEIEYIIRDGGSSDKTLEIIKEYEHLLLQNKFPIKCKKISYLWVSEKDTGMYDAVNKGFSTASGDIFAWINSDDLYVRDAFETIRKTMVTFPDISWVKGITSFIKPDGNVYQYGRCFIYNQDWIKLGIYGRNSYFIHQDSVFWRKSLWEKAGHIDSEYKLAGDYALWIKFSQISPLWSINKEISYFRKSPEQLSNNMELYRKEQKQISQEKGFLTWKVKVFFWLQSKRPHWLQPLMVIVYNILFLEKNRHFIDVDTSGNLIQRKTLQYIVS